MASESGDNEGPVIGGKMERSAEEGSHGACGLVGDFEFEAEA